MSEATIAGSTAALKILYPKGELPKSINEMFNYTNRLKKETDFVGESAYVALQNAFPQGSSGDFDQAQANIQQGNYVRFNLTRARHYGIARITGEAAEAAVKSEGALVDLWDNETKGAAITERSVLEVYALGDGTGVLGTMGGSGAVAATTVTLAAGTNMNYFELGMSLNAVTDATLSPTLRVGKAKISGIDRRNRTLTFASNLSVLITSVANTDYFVRAGDYSAAGANEKVIAGLEQYIAGGTSPGTLFGLNRNTDPVRLAGQKIDYSGWAMEDALVDASAQAGFQGIGYPNLFVCNNIDLANMKKSLGAKITYPREGDSKTSTSHSFSKLTIEGEAGPIELLATPFCKRFKGFLIKPEAFSLFSLKAAPHLVKYDGMDFLRRPDQDAYEVRFAMYGNQKCKNPGPQVQLTNFGL